MIDEFGTEYTSYILAVSTVAERGCIDEIGRALYNREKKENEKLINEGKKPNKEKYTLDYLKNIKIKYETYKNTLIDVEDSKEKIIATTNHMKKTDSKIFKYFLGILGTPVAQSIHPAGMIVSPITLADNYGVVSRNGMKILQLDMNDVHEINLVKYDILGLKNVQIIKETCSLAGIEYPKAHEIDWNDKSVWDDMLKSPVGIDKSYVPFISNDIEKLG